ncbi:hypothetical protein, partial [Paraburkholderia bengalensis]|uniref:hypothetical protein n=1 Tax=Paraburkholderia bengalensis TaxID=2747562 RepID=UPI00301512D7
MASTRGRTGDEHQRAARRDCTGGNRCGSGSVRAFGACRAETGSRTDGHVGCIRACECERKRERRAAARAR